MFPNPIWVNKQTMPGFLKDLKYIGKLGKTYSIILGVILAAFTVLVIYDASVIRNSLNENMLDQGRVISTGASAEIRSYMQKPSKIFNVAGYSTFTSEDKCVTEVLTEFANASRFYLRSNAFNESSLIF